MTTTSTATAAAPIVTPKQMVERFCDARDVGALADPTKTGGVTTCHGFCGYTGGEGDSLVVGFDEGYDFMDYLTARGWTPISDKGDWPYMIYLSFQAGDPLAVAAYCEGEVTISQFDNKERFEEFCRKLS